MSDKINNGGPAFPSLTYCANGMTLRDYFAGQALAGMAANRSIDLSRTGQVALSAYSLADAMLKAREASNG